MVAKIKCDKTSNRIWISPARASVCVYVCMCISLSLYIYICVTNRLYIKRKIDTNLKLSIEFAGFEISCNLGELWSFRHVIMMVLWLYTDRRRGKRKLPALRMEYRSLYLSLFLSLSIYIYVYISFFMSNIYWNQHHS